jgi:hypothetical protein
LNFHGAPGPTRALASELAKLISQGNIEVIDEAAVEVPPEAAIEAEPAATIYVRVPSSLKRRVDEAAKDAKLSGNAYVLRCMETCLKTISDFKELFYIAIIASNAPDSDWSVDKLQLAHGKIDDYAHALMDKMFGERGSMAGDGSTRTYSDMVGDPTADYLQTDVPPFETDIFRRF